MTSRSLAIVHAVLLAAVALIAGCRGARGTPAVDAQQLLATAASRMERPGPFHFEMTQQNGTSTIAGGLQMTAASGDVAASDRLRIRVRAKAGPLDVDLGIVILPDASYITNPLTGTWERSTISVAALFDPGAGMPVVMRAATEPRVVGTEKIGDIRTYRVEAKVDAGALSLLAPGAAAGRSLVTRAWIGVDAPLVYRLEVAGAATAAEPDNMLRRLELSRFGEDPQIVPPALGAR